MFRLLVLVAVHLALAGPAFAQTPSTPADRSLVVGTREAPPFAMKNEDGQWSGLSIELWESVADTLGYDYRYEELPLQGLLDGVASGELDAAVSALTITPGREAEMDFSHPFYSTGFAIAVDRKAQGWFSALAAVFSWQFLQAVAALAIVLGLVGLLFWLTERKRNPEQFGGEPLAGLWSGF